jgi:hypothetical protein
MRAQLIPQRVSRGGEQDCDSSIFILYIVRAAASRWRGKDTQRYMWELSAASYEVRSAAYDVHLAYFHLLPTA